MTREKPAELQRRIAAEFERNGWDYDLSVGRELVAAIERSGPTDAQTLARLVPSDFLIRNGTTREAVAEALGRTVAGRSVEPTVDTTLVINDNRYSINLGPGAEIEGSTINVGGTQVVVSVTVDKRDVLTAVETLVRAGLSGQWNAAAAKDLAAIIDQRGDVSVDEIRELATEIAQTVKPSPERVRSFLSDVAANAVGGALGVGISAGLGFLF